MASLDMLEILQDVYDISDSINNSELVARYLEKKRLMAEDESAQRLIRQFQQKKERFEEAKRFGHFHPDYHQAKKEAHTFRREMEKHPVIGAYLKAEHELDELLFHVIKTIAHAVSPTIKIPSNDPRLERSTIQKKSCG
ncbi:MAG: YlbF family regulator [Novibacillus thermophilus]|nr:YlbF family regulator [Novibacillus thermophilus]